MNAQDFKLIDNDLAIENGDFGLAESDQQHVEDLIKYHPGHLKEFPTVGVGLSKYQNSSGQEQEIARAIRIVLESDGYKVNTVEVKDYQNIYIDAERL